MDAITIATLARALERILDVAAGTLATYWGFRLFSLLPATQTDSNGRFELPGVKVVFARVGPGLLFAGLGAMILGVSLKSPLSLPLPDKGKEASSMSFAVGQGANLTPTLLAKHLSELNCIGQILPRPKTEYPGDAAPALEAAREALLLANWRKEWGDPSDFQKWVRDPAIQGVNSEVQRLFHFPPPEVCIK